MRVLLSILCLLIGAPDQEDVDERRKDRLEASRAIVSAAADAAPLGERPVGDLPDDIRIAIEAWAQTRTSDPADSTDA
jgi:hypothetical protein